jgi:NitT/TauT family transport system permease protein
MMPGPFPMQVPGIFLPNKAVTKRTFGIIAAFELCLALILWQTQSGALMPTVTDILSAFPGLWKNGFGQELLTSFKLCLQAIALTTLISLAIVYATVLPVFQPIAEAASKGRFLGLVGLSFIFTLLASSGHSLKLMMLVFGMSVFFITSMLSVIKAIPKSDFDYARTLGMSEWQIVWEVVILGRVSVAIDMLQQNFAIGWVMLTTVEGISRGEGGVGKLLLDSNKHFALADIFAIQLSILILGLLIDYVIGLINRIACPYAFINLERS